MPKALDGGVVGREAARVLGVVLQVVNVDVVLGARDEGGQLAVAEHAQPVQSNHITHSLPK